MKQVYEMEVFTRTRSVYGVMASSEEEAKKITGDIDFFETAQPMSATS